MTCELWEDRLDAYLDGETPARDLPALEAHLRTCRDCAAEALTRMQTKRATRAAAAMRFAPPPDFRLRVQQSVAPRRSRPSFFASPALPIALAACLVLAIGISSAVFVRRTAPEQALAQLVDMHVAALASPNPVDVVSSDRHTVKPWFQGKLPFTFNLPELAGSPERAASPYTLRGGRLVYFHSNPGAQLIYQLGKHEFSVFLLPDTASQSAPPASERRNGFTTESWTAAGLRCVVISDAGSPDVHALADMMRAAQQH